MPLRRGAGLAGVYCRVRDPRPSLAARLAAGGARLRRRGAALGAAGQAREPCTRARAAGGAQRPRVRRGVLARRGGRHIV